MGEHGNKARFCYKGRCRRTSKNCLFGTQSSFIGVIKINFITRLLGIKLNNAGFKCVPEVCVFILLLDPQRSSKILMLAASSLLRR